LLLRLKGKGKAGGIQKSWQCPSDQIEALMPTIIKEMVELIEKELDNLFNKGEKRQISTYIIKYKEVFP